jgi:acetate kinase
MKRTANRDGGLVLVLNAGSSSIKFGVYGAGLDSLARGEIEGIGTSPRFHAHSGDDVGFATRIWKDSNPSVHTLIESLIDWIEQHFGRARVLAAGHRVVLGGPDDTRPVLIDEAVLDRLSALIPLAPVHQPRNLEPIEALARLQPKLPQVACFDTSFHRTMPETAQLYGLPRSLTEAGARRYGFHGISYEYIAGVLPQFDKRAAAGRTVVAHLGGGASMCALVAGRSVATTMGFSPLSGLLMGTRPGEIDPGLILWMMQAKGMSLEEVETMLYHGCGLKGDALVFTAGIGENAASVREAVCQHCAWLGIALDRRANARNADRISSAASPVSVWVIPTDEERMIATHTLALVGAVHERRSA